MGFVIQAMETAEYEDTPSIRNQSKVENILQRVPIIFKINAIINFDNCEQLESICYNIFVI